MRRSLLALLALSALLAAACGGGAEPEGKATEEPGDRHTAECVDLTGSATAEVVLLDNHFEPGCMTVSSDQSFTIRNDGAALHSFTVEGSGLDLDVKPGEETNTEAVGGILEPGTYKLFCKYHPPGMVADLTVE